MSVKDLNNRTAIGRGNQTSSTRMFSPNLWADCPAYELANGLKDGFVYFDDFLGNYVQAASVAASASTLQDPWAAFTNATAGATVASVVSPTDAVGAIKLLTTTAQEGVHAGVHMAKNLTVPIDALSSTNRVWFEGRFKVSTITTTEACFFFGLIKVGRLVTLGTMATGGAAPAAVDGLGFFKATVTAPTALQTYLSNGTATVQDAAAATLVADTYVKAGYYWNGTTGTFYVNGTANATTHTSASTQFPAGENLGLAIGLMAGAAGTAQTASVDWIRYAFERTATSLT